MPSSQTPITKRRDTGVCSNGFSAAHGLKFCLLTIAWEKKWNLSVHKMLLLHSLPTSSWVKNSEAKYYLTGTLTRCNL